MSDLKKIKIAKYIEERGREKEGEGERGLIIQPWKSLSSLLGGSDSVSSSEACEDFAGVEI